jgi:diguanylate cyclase (GGDEF)-like protein/PAS domain S-box-containing protein
MGHQVTISGSGAGYSVPPPPGGTRGDGQASPKTVGTGVARALAIAAIALGAATVVGTTALIIKLRNQALADAEQRVANIAFMLAEQTDRSFEAVELLQTNLMGRMTRLEIKSADELERRLSGYDGHVLLKDTMSGLPYVSSVALIGPQGNAIVSSRAWPLPAVNVADRDYFKELVSTTGEASFVSAPVVNRVDHARSIYLARKYLSPEHELISIVLAGLDLPSFEDMFGAVARGAGVEIALVRGDHTLLAHYPRLEGALERQDDRGTLFESGAWFLEHDATRVAAVNSLPHFPALISVSAPVSGALAAWRSEALYLAGAAAFVVLMIAGVAFLAVRQLGSYLRQVKAGAEKDAENVARAAAQMVMQERKRIREQRGEQELRLAAATNHLSHGVVMFDAQARLVVCNEPYSRMYDLSPEVVRPGTPLRTILSHRIHRAALTADPDELAKKIVASVFSGKVTHQVTELRDGRVVDIQTQPLENGGWVATHEDITERRRAERELERTQQFLASVIENVPTIIAVKDARNLRFTLINRAGEVFFGVKRSEILGKTAHDLFPKETADTITSHDRELLRTNKEVFIDEHPITTPAGRKRVATARRIPVGDNKGVPQFLLSLVDDVTERREAERRIAHIADHDAMTGLPNRAALAKHLGARIEHVNVQKRGFAVLCIDFDRFKEINDVFGQATGDDVMLQCARRLQATAQGAFLAHLGSDKFVLVTPYGAQPAGAETLCERLLTAMAEALDVERHPVRVDLSIGVAIFPNDGTDVAALLGNADAALHRAKAEGRGTFRFFHAEVDHALRDKRALHRDLLGAIERGELAMNYQPQARGNSEVVGFESLVRWHHPGRGLVEPADFIPLAEESGQIVAIGEWTLREACREAATWARPLHVAVNVSTAQFRDGDFVGLVNRVLRETGLAADRLEIEITEGALVGDFSRAVSNLRRLKALGVGIAMDDFGTGYSSLSHLRAFAFDKIKIDRSFVMDLDEDPQAEAMLRGIVELAHGLKLAVAAEGVETKEQLALLRRVACDEMQGYLIGRPHPIEHYANIVKPASVVNLRTARAS